MTPGRFSWRSLVFYRRTHAAVACSVASAVAMFAGALLVGGSIRASLAQLAADRLGRTNVVITSARPFSESVAHADVFAPLFSLDGAARHESSGRRAFGIQVYGVDRRFFSFHHASTEPPGESEVLLSADLADELKAAVGDAVLLRVTKPADIPIDSLQGRKDAGAAVVRLRYRGTLPAGLMGDFSLTPAQGPVRSAFVALPVLQRELDHAGRVNLVLVAASPAAGGVDAIRAALKSRLSASDYGLTLESQPPSTVIVESASGLLSDRMAAAVETAARQTSLEVTPVLTWLANRLTTSGRSVPYSLVTGLGEAAGGDATLAAFLGDGLASVPNIVLNEWAARDLGATPGSDVDLEYYRWADEGRLVTAHARFRLAGVVPMQGVAGDRRLAPAYPGITDSDSVADWNPPFPIDLKLVRPADEMYWREFRTTPKAFVPLAAAQRLWGSRYGRVTSLRLRTAGPAGALDALTSRLRDAAARAIDPTDAGFSVSDVRRQSAQASAGATDFSVYFASFSAFLLVSALILTGLFFRLNLEQRFAQAGVLRATGYSVAAVSRLWLREGALVALAGCVLGLALAVVWAALMIHGLGTWWVGASGTSRLRLHVDAWSLAAGAIAGFAAGAIAIALTLRAIGRLSPRALITGAGESAFSPDSSRPGWLALSAAIAAAALVAGSLTGVVPAAGGFFGAGACVLTAGLAMMRRWLGRRSVAAPLGMAPLIRIGISNTSWRPTRSLTSAGLMAVAVFLIVAVDAFRRDTTPGAADAGAGGFALVGESAIPVVRDPSTPEGQEALGLSPNDEPVLRDVHITPARLRAGDDTSCLNLYRPTRPRVVGVPDRFIETGRFRFSRSLASTDEDRRNPWRLLRMKPQTLSSAGRRVPSAEAAAIPAIADATSLEYVLHAAVGDEIMIDADTARPLRLKIVGALSDSVLQGELLIAESSFLAAFPDAVGYRVFLIDAPSRDETTLDGIAAALETQLEPFGFDAQSTAQRLAAYHQVENTYLSAFQALGGLGLVLGMFGLAAVVARNLFERRHELALLAATGYTGRHLQTMMLAEVLALAVGGLVIGVVAASIATLPVIIARASGPPALPLAWIAATLVTAVLSGLWSTRAVRRLRLVESLSRE